MASTPSAQKKAKFALSNKEQSFCFGSEYDNISTKDTTQIQNIGNNVFELTEREEK